MRIYQKLNIIILGLVLIPFSIASFLFFYNSEKDLKKEIFSELNTVADFKVAKIQDFFLERKNDMDIYVNRYIVKLAVPVLDKFKDDTKNPSYMQIKKTLDEQFTKFKDIYKCTGVFLLNKEGEVIYSLSEGYSDIGLGTSLKDAQVFKEGKSGVYMSDIFKLKNVKHKFGMFMSAPMYDPDDKFNGVFAIEFDMAPIFDSIQDTTGLGGTGETLLIKEVKDRSDKKKDYALFLNTLRYDPDAALNRKSYFEEAAATPAQKAARGERGSGVEVDYRNKKVLAAWRYIPSLNWGLVAKLDIEEALRPVATLKRIFYAIFISMVFLVAVITLFVAKSFSDPIHRLHAGVEALDKGNLDYRVSTNAKDEIGQLSRSFDKMAEDLKKSTTSIENLNNEIAVRKMLEEELHALAIYDDLTKLFNRRGFFTLAEQQLEIAIRYKIDMHLFFVDMDNLKKINDTLGHAEGDKALVKVATALKKVYRAADIVARIGGDEFAILTIKTKESDIPVIIKRLNEAIDNLNAGNLPSSPKLSVTIGVAHCDPSNRCLLKDLLDEADRIMYSNKKKQA